MPRPTPVQVAYGSLTVVLSTFAMLLLSGVRSGGGVAGLGAAGLLLGLFVAASVGPRTRRSAAAPVLPAAPARSVPVPRARVGGAEHLVGERSLRN